MGTCKDFPSRVVKIPPAGSCCSARVTSQRLLRCEVEYARGLKSLDLKSRRTVPSCGVEFSISGKRNMKWFCLVIIVCVVMFFLPTVHLKIRK